MLAALAGLVQKVLHNRDRRIAGPGPIHLPETPRRLIHLPDVSVAFACPLALGRRRRPLAHKSPSYGGGPWREQENYLLPTFIFSHSLAHPAHSRTNRRSTQPPRDGTTKEALASCSQFEAERPACWVKEFIWPTTVRTTVVQCGGTTGRWWRMVWRRQLRWRRSARKKDLTRLPPLVT